MLHALRRATAAAIVVLSLNSFVGAEPTVSGPLPTDLLPTDPALVSGKLDNGLKYIVRKHANPQGRAVMWIHFDTGSLNETEQQRGIAHYLEHMAFNGSDNYPPGSLIPFFQSLGMQFGRDQNAFTGFDQTVYQLSLPNTEETTLDKGLTFFADVAGRLTLSPGEI
ncbi:MAG TPA: insulinase family protein, partial [Tepidisphaeraceae bacterium]|nr:insulinase family protein [Tepidisphaeraceae bacterium]